MPELPEVETIANELRHAGLIGKTIGHIEIFWPKIVDKHSPAEFYKLIINQKIVDIKRRGKFLVFQLSKNVLLVHLRMTGKILITSSKENEPQKNEHLQIHFTDNSTLHYEDQRKFGRWYLISNTEDKLSNLGLEPLSADFTLQALEKMLLEHTIQIKSFLLNQRFIAGLGNIYVDEALWEAKIHPKASTQSLSKKQAKDLHNAIQNVLKRGIANLGTSLGKHRSNYFSASGKWGSNQEQLKVFHREGQPCQRCHEKIIKTKVAQRGTYLCPNCQTFVYL